MKEISVILPPQNGMDTVGPPISALIRRVRQEFEFFAVDSEPCFASASGGQKQSLPASGALAQKWLSLPSDLALTEIQVRTVRGANKEIKTVLQEKAHGK